MKRFHVKHGMKKVLAFSLAMALIAPSVITASSIRAVAAEDDGSLPAPAKLFTLEKGFKGDGLKQAKFGQLIGMIEDKYPAGHTYEGVGYFNQNDGRLTGKYQEVDKVLVQFEDPKSYDYTNIQNHKGYKWTNIPPGEKQQYLPDIKTSNGEWMQLSCAWNQPTTAYDEEKGMVFWMDNTLINESYPTYATKVNWDAGTWKTEKDVIVKDTSGQYQEFEIINSAAEFDNPFAASTTPVTGLTFSAWIKNTTPARSSVTYGKLGDVNGNRFIDTDDAGMVLRHTVSGNVLSETAAKYADVDGVPGISTDDASCLLKVTVGAMLESELQGNIPEEGEEGEVEEPEPLEDAEFFHVEIRELGKTYNEMTKKDETDERNITKRQYLYFSGNGVVYVGDFGDIASTCTWTLDEDSKNSAALNILDGRNGSKWNYVSYTFDGTNFHMYVNGHEAGLTRTAGDSYSADGILELVQSSKAKTYLGGRGGGMKDSFNTFRINTRDTYYMDDIAVYTSELSSNQIAQAYSAALSSKEAAEEKTATKLKEYKFDSNRSLALNQLSAAPNSRAEYQPEIGVEGKSGYAIKLKASEQSANGGVQLAANPFANKKDLTGVTVSYWLKAVRPTLPNGIPLAVQDGLVLSFVDTVDKECTTDKLRQDGFSGPSAMAKSQLYFNQAYIGWFIEGVTKGLYSNLKNTFTYKPYPYGDPNSTDMLEWRKQFETKNHTNGGSYYSDWQELKNSLASDWHFVTITINNAGFTMYLDGEEVKNRCVDYRGERFCDYYQGRLSEIISEVNRKGGNNGGATSLMEFLTDYNTKVFIGFAYESGSETSYLTTTECYLDELAFYDKDMSAAEVKALYEDSIK